MTKLLNVITGEYISFVSSLEYDSKNSLGTFTQVLQWEDSYPYSVGEKLEDRVSQWKEGMLYYEIIYD